MGNRVRIGIEENGIIKSVYVHFGRNASETLKKYEPEEIKNLIDMGDISYLSDNISKSIFYNRDKGERTFPRINYFRNFRGYELPGGNEFYIFSLSEGKFLVWTRQGFLAF